MPGCSEAPRGLFVLSRAGRVFTATSISPGPSPRQRPTRYALRAGRNLPDKEFRYLRTVIVTAAVHRGFGSSLAALPLTSRHWAGVSPYTSPSGFAETCVFGKQSVGPILCRRRAQARATAPHPRRPPFSRSYGVKLPSSLAKVPPFTLAASCQPTSVGLRYGRPPAWLGAFLGGTGATPSPAGRPAGSRRPSGPARPDFPGRAPYGRRRALSTARRASPPPRPPFARDGGRAVQES
jgi:hypothetical protein